VAGSGASASAALGKATAAKGDARTGVLVAAPAAAGPGGPAAAVGDATAAKGEGRMDGGGSAPTAPAKGEGRMDGGAGAGATGGATAAAAKGMAAMMEMWDVAGPGLAGLLSGERAER